MSIFETAAGRAIDFDARRDAIIHCDDQDELRAALQTPGLQRVIEQMLRRKLRRLVRAAAPSARRA